MARLYHLSNVKLYRRNGALYGSLPGICIFLRIGSKTNDVL